MSFVGNIQDIVPEISKMKKSPKQLTYDEFVLTLKKIEKERLKSQCNCKKPEVTFCYKHKTVKFDRATVEELQQLAQIAQFRKDHLKYFGGAL